MYLVLSAFTSSSVSMCGRINSTKSPASDAGNVSEPWLMSHVESVREVVCAEIRVLMPSVVVEVEFCLLTWELQSRGWGRRTLRLVGPALKVVMQIDRHFMDVIL
jgi:hypothetical protein